MSLERVRLGRRGGVDKKNHRERYAEVHTTSFGNHTRGVPIYYNSNKLHAVSAMKEAEKRQGEKVEDK